MTGKLEKCKKCGEMKPRAATTFNQHPICKECVDHMKGVKRYR